MTDDVKPMTEAEKNLRECQEQLDMDGVMVGVSRQALEETLAELDASRVREAKLVEALRQCLGWIDAWSPEFTQDDAWPEARHCMNAALSPYTPAEMPSDCHPEGK